MITNLHIICQENEHKAIGSFFSAEPLDSGFTRIETLPVPNITQHEKKAKKIPPDGGILLL